ncbi:MAG: hypothetical protein NDP13_04705 [Crenarchaeota archaeon]|nr:hypothetical protein [Thermoproteota archaeon]MCR8455041.1 hypothetical protein [Thermoproteota archaeon]
MSGEGLATEIDLPSWFLFGKRLGEYSLDALLLYGKERIDMLLEFSQRRTLEALNSMSGKFNNLVGLVALILAASATNDMYFISWLLEIEGDLFTALFNKLDLGKKVAVLRYILGELLVGIEVVSQKLGMSTESLLPEIQSILPKLTEKRQARDFLIPMNRFLAAARFSRAYRLIKSSRAIAIRGWVIAPLEEFFRLSKSHYQDMLSEKIQMLSEKIKKDPEFQSYKAFGEELISYWRKKMIVQKPVVKRDLVTTEDRLWERIDTFPPCLRILYDRFISTGYLPHIERLQLGLLLKALGMPLEEQLKLWYRAVDNVGLTWEQFLKKGGYYIRHLYGLEGSRKDYRPPKCETIITRYFCPFVKTNFTELKELIRGMNPAISSSELDKIHEEIISREPRKACARLLASIIKNPNLKISTINHPIQFSRIVYKHSRVRTNESKGKSSENLQENVPQRYKP